jgi:predicted nuclease with RNAse H fold
VQTGLTTVTRTVAIDWSGRASGARTRIWVAAVEDGELVFLENGRNRAEVVQLVIELASVDSKLVAGFDFAFSFPAWFLEQHGFEAVRELWAAAALHGEEWLAACNPPFWGRPGKQKPNLAGREHFRTTERLVQPIVGVRPKSVFQIGGAGAVGTGSIRGMPVLTALSAAGFSIWPFDRAGWPRVVEIYPRALTGAVRKSSKSGRDEYLSGRNLISPASLRTRVASSEDAFDAAVSALVMWKHRSELGALDDQSDKVGRLEGTIWYPSGSAE